MHDLYPWSYTVSSAVGRNPRPIADFEGTSVTALTDNAKGINQNASRIREIAMQTMAQG